MAKTFLEFSFATVLQVDVTLKLRFLLTEFFYKTQADCGTALW